MNKQLNKYLHLVLSAGLFCAVTVLPVAAQDFSGQRGDISISEQIKLQHFLDLPVGILLTDEIYSESTLSYQNRNGDLRPYQHPEYSQDFSLTSYGLTSFKGIRLEGRFQYLKELHDGVGWKLVRDAYHEPYYYGNIRPGDWDNDRYNIELNGGTSFFDDRLLLSLGVDYRVEQLARYNDPRPSINFYNLFWKSQLGWRANNHSLALYYGSGSADENGSVTNYDRANDSFGKRKYNIISVFGIGSYSLRKRTSYEKPTDRTELGFSYQYNNSRWELTAEVIAGKIKSIFGRDLSNNRATENVILGKYFEDYVNGKLFLTIPAQNHTLQLLSTTKWSDGYDENINYSGTNYFHSNLRQQLRFFYYNADETLALQAGIGYNDQSFVDRNASHSYSYQRLHADLSLQLSKDFGPRSISIIPAISFAKSPANSISVPVSSRNLLTKYLVSPDYYLHTSDVLGLRGGFQIRQNFENLEVALLVDYQRRTVVGNGIMFGEPEYRPGKNRNTLSLTLQFFH